MKFYDKFINYIYRIYLIIIGLRCPKDAVIRGFPKVFISKEGNVSIGSSFTLRSGSRRGIGNESTSKIMVSAKSTLKIGCDVGMTNVCLLCQNEINIGNHVLLGAGVMIMDSNFHDLNWEGRMDESHGITGAKTAPVNICDNVFIGTRSIICKGVTIGSRSIIAAGSVVVKSIPEDEIWGGNPAKFIKKLY